MQQEFCASGDKNVGPVVLMSIGSMQHPGWAHEMEKYTESTPQDRGKEADERSRREADT